MPVMNGVSSLFPRLTVDEKDDLNIVLKFVYWWDTLHFTFPKGTWVNVEVIAELNPTLGFILHVLKLNNSIVHYKIEQTDFVKSLLHDGQSVEAVGEWCQPVTPIGGLQYLCVDGFYRNLQIDFGTCGEPG